MADINSLDLNLLRLFDAVYRNRNVSRAAQELGLSQPSASQGLARLRLLLRDPLFERMSSGVRPTDRAERLSRSVQAGLALLEAGLADDKAFDPSTSSHELRIHLTDIGESHFLPRIMAMFQKRAPNLQVRSQAYPHDTIAFELDRGHLHFAIGYLPILKGLAQSELFPDRYQVFLRADHPVKARAVNGTLDAQTLATLEFAAVRSHRETISILQTLHLEPRIRLITGNFSALPAVVRSTDLAALMPRAIALGIEPRQAFELLEPGLPQRDFSVALHWSRRHQHDAMLRWARETLSRLLSDDGADS